MATDLRFEWDPAKNTLNLGKQKVSFDEASSAFLDENALVIDDPDHSEAEDRFILLGVSSALRILLVCHCCRAKEGIIRIFSARKADRQERQDYLRRFKA